MHGSASVAVGGYVVVREWQWEHGRCVAVGAPARAGLLSFPEAECCRSYLHDTLLIHKVVPLSL